MNERQFCDYIIPEYPGKILSGKYGVGLKSRVADCIDGFRFFEKLGNPAVPYLSAWQEKKKGMWYEYLSPRFTGLFQCSNNEFADVFRSSIVERRVYRQLEQESRIEAEIIVHKQMNDARIDLRREGQTKGLVEAIYRVSIPEGRDVWLKDQAFVESYETEGILLSCGCLTDVSKEMEAEATLKRAETKLQTINRQLQQLATMDGLTQIANRRQFDIRINREWRRLSREKSLLSIIMCDIDHFKKYNDTYGHQMGDDCLKTIASTIANTARRASDLVARYGGEEFVVVLPGTDVDGAMQVAHDIRDSINLLKLPHSSSPVSPFVTVSIGVAAMIPDAGTSPRHLIERADKTLYEAKNSGRDRIFSLFGNCD